MRITLKNQKGFTLTPALFILSLIMIAGTVYILYINSSGKTVRKLETANVAKYAAETGIMQFKSQLAQLNEVDATKKAINKWYNAKAFDHTPSDPKYIFLSTAGNNEALRNASNTARVSNYISLKDSSGKVISQYRITIEDGSYLPSSTKTTTGSTIEGKDKYGNNIWSDSGNNFFKDKEAFRYGVRSDGFSVNSAGNTDKGSQSIYAVIDDPVSMPADATNGWTPGSPAGFLLSTNGHEPQSNPVNDRYLNLISGQVLTGPIHSNNKLIFTWRGNWDTGIWQNWNTANPTIDPFRNSVNNDNYTVHTGRFSGYLTDPSPVLIKKVVKEENAPVDQLTIYGLNFNSDKTKNIVSINGISIPSANIEVSAYTQPKNPPTIPNDILTTTITRIRLKVPTTLTLPYLISIRNTDRSQTIKYKLTNIPTIEADDAHPINKKESPIRIYGILQVKADNTTPYKGGIDYELIGPPTYNYFNGSAYFYEPYIHWIGTKPSNNSYYSVTYITENNIPHNSIKVFDNISYSGAPPLLKYIHSHKTEGTTGLSLHPFSDTHSHPEVFGMTGINLSNANAPNDYFRNTIGYYDWEYDHQHLINSSLLSFDTLSTPYIYQKDLFFSWASTSFRPKLVSPKVAPILAPNNVNFKTQRTYVDQLFKIMLNRNLSKDGSGNLGSLSEISEDRANGYYVGNQDFRATYFGNDLKYSVGSLAGQYVLPVGSAMDATSTIYVDDNPASSSYMKVTNVATAGYKYYTYRQIPKNGSTISTDSKHLSDGGIIFVKDGVIKIGGADHQGTIKSSIYQLGTIYGNNTIIDGRLSIISYSEEKPTTYGDNNINLANDNKGDIVITGNVIYKNKIVPLESTIVKKDYDYKGFRQYTSSIPISSIDANGFPTGSSGFITETDGQPVDNIPIGEKINSLALIASNDIKIPVSNYNQTDSYEKIYTQENEPACPCKDTLTVHGQLIAGHKIGQTKVEDDFSSKNDRIILYGSFFSYEPPNLSYFDRTNPNNRDEDGLGRLYLYDKTLSQLPLAGSPKFPKDNSYSADSYPVVAAGLPRIVPGTWKVVSDGAQ